MWLPKRAGVAPQLLSRARLLFIAEFAERFAPAGFAAEAFVPSYGLAEATLAVTFSPLGQGLSVDVVDRGRTLEVDRRAVRSEGNGRSRAGRSFVMCGRPMPGYAVEIRDSQNLPRPERAIGREVCAHWTAQNAPAPLIAALAFALTAGALAPYL